MNWGTTGRAARDAADLGRVVPAACSRAAVTHGQDCGDASFCSSALSCTFTSSS